MVLGLCLDLICSNNVYLTQSLMIGLSEFISKCRVTSDHVFGWKKRVASDLCPHVALITRSGLSPGSSFQPHVPLGVSYLIQACSLLTKSTDVQDGLLIAVSILVAAAEIEPLQSMAIKTLTALPSNPTLGAAFSDCLRQLPNNAKSRLQSSIKAASTLRNEESSQVGQPSVPASLSSISKGPAIQLKKFV